MATRDPHTRHPVPGSLSRRRSGPRDRSAGLGRSAPPPPDVRSEITVLSGFNVLAGIWLVIAPWVLGYSATDPKWNDVVFGAVIGLLALTRATGASRAEWLSWINALIGAWLFVSAFTIDHSTVAAWNDAVAGVAVCLLAIGSADAAGRLLPGRRASRPRSF